MNFYKNQQTCWAGNDPWPSYRAWRCTKSFLPSSNFPIIEIWKQLTAPSVPDGFGDLCDSHNLVVMTRRQCFVVYWHPIKGFSRSGLCPYTFVIIQEAPCKYVEIEFYYCILCVVSTYFKHKKIIRDTYKDALRRVASLATIIKMGETVESNCWKHSKTRPEFAFWKFLTSQSICHFKSMIKFVCILRVLNYLVDRLNTFCEVYTVHFIVRYHGQSCSFVQRLAKLRGLCISSGLNPTCIGVKQNLVCNNKL